MKRVIGITGGIASGKSNVSNICKELGYEVIDSDSIVKELSEKNKPLYNAYLKEFGPDFLDLEGNLDKKKLGKLIFNNLELKKKMDKISHPLVVEEIKNRISNINDGLIFVDIPLLYEAKLEYLCDKVICVFLKKKLQVERLMARDGIDEDYALAKIHSQMDLYMKKELADYVINSQGEFSETKKQVVNVINDILGGK
ncbi:MAG: dephospho-CoA kinase [Acholeplasmatales bacterium]|nr:dephospho-CoA kinase [Acholeplasmatales bacterium]